MIDLTTPIIPYKGTGIFNLNSTYDTVKNLLKEYKIKHREKILNENLEEPAWTVIDVYASGYPYEVLQLFFVKGILFKICVWENFEGKLPNGIHTGMNLLEAKKIDPQLKRDDEIDEIFLSSEGYWIEYSNGTLNIINISIFISEFESEDFFDYNR